MRFLISLIFALAAVSSAAHAAPLLEAYGRLPAIDFVSLSPDGEHFALVGRDGDTRKLYVRKLDGTPEFIAPIGNARIRDLQWAGSDRLLVFGGGTVYAPLAGLRRQEFMGVMHIDVRKRTSYVLFGKSQYFVDAVFGWFGTVQQDGKWYAYVGAVPLAKTRSGGLIYPDLYKVDLDTGKPTIVDASDASTRWVVAADGQVVGHSRYDQRGRTFTIYNGTDSGRPILTRELQESAAVLIGQGRTAGSILYGFQTSEGQEVRELHPGGPPDGEVLLTGAEADADLRDRETRLLIGVAQHGGKFRLYNVDFQKRLDAALKAFPGRRASLISYDRTFERQVIFTEGPEDPGTYWLVEIAKRTAVPIGAARPELKPADVGPVRMVKYKAADGLEMEGVLTLPPGREAKGLPLVMLPHGGPVVPGDEVSFDWWAQAFASRGYAVFQPNYRGTLGYGDPFRRAALGQFGRKMQTDLSDGVAELARQGIVDPKRVCIVGASYGGYAALAGVTLQQGVYRCAVSVAGPADLGKLMIWIRARAGGDERSARFWRGLMGTTGGQDLETISPAKLAEKASAPILLIHGETDTVVPIEQSRMMEKALRQAGKSVELVTMTGEDHWLSQETTRQLMLNRAIAFVEKNDPAN